MSEQVEVIRSLGDIEREICAEVQVGCRASLRIAVRVAYVQEHHFATNPEWLTWCERMHFARRTSFQLAKVGRFMTDLGLVEPVHDRALDEVVHDRALVPTAEKQLLALDLHRLEHLAELYEQKPEQLIPLLERWNPAEHTIRQVAEKVAMFVGPKMYTLTCGDCHEEFESERRSKKRCDSCQKRYEEKQEREKERRESHKVDRMICSLAEMWGQDEALERVVEDLAPGVTFRAALVCIDLAGANVRDYTTLSAEDLLTWIGEMEEAIDRLRTLAGEAK